MKIHKIWISWMVLFGVVVSGCTLTINSSDLANSVKALETQISQQEQWLSANATQVIAQRDQLSYQSTQIAKQEEWLSYQSTQIGAHQGMIMYLATGAPTGQEGSYGFPQDGTLTPTPYYPVNGSVIIHQGSCCVGGKSGTSIEVDVQFEAHSVNGEVTEMRVLAGAPLVDETQIADASWEPFIAEKLFPVPVAINWTTFWVHVQYRDATGALSPVFSDEIGVEGN